MTETIGTAACFSSAAPASLRQDLVLPGMGGGNKNSTD